MKINFKKLSDTAIAPTKGHYNDAGFDLGIICENANYGEDVYYTEKLFDITNAVSEIDVAVSHPEDTRYRTDRSR